MGRFKGYTYRSFRLQAVVVTGLLFVVMGAFALGQQPPPTLPGQQPPPTTPTAPTQTPTPAQPAPQPNPASGDPKFTAAEITNPKIAITKLRGDNSLLNMYLRSKLAPAAQLTLLKYDPMGEPSPEMVQIIVDVLNAAIDDDGFYNPSRFEGVKISKETQDALRTNPTGPDRKLLNRHLLEDAYPEFLAKIGARVAPSANNAANTTPPVQPLVTNQQGTLPVPTRFGPDFLDTEAETKTSPVYGFDYFAAARTKLDKINKDTLNPSLAPTTPSVVSPTPGTSNTSGVGQPITPGMPINPVGFDSDRYQLGPGDVLQMHYGSKTLEAQDVELKLNEQGYVNLPSGDKLIARGQTLAQFEQNVKRIMRTKFRNVDVQVTMRELRTVKVTIMGESYAPGTYYVPASYTLFNLLYLSGGPNDGGSLRNIQLKRGSTIYHFDFYRFMMANDKAQDIPIQAGDVLFISLSGPRVRIAGEVRRAYTFELTQGQSLKDAIAYAGGIKPTAAKVVIDTVDQNRFRKILNFDILELAKSDSLILKEGDAIRVTSVRTRVKDKVTIEGAVDQPGSFPIAPNMHVSDLVALARKTTEDAYLERADLYRLNPDNTYSLYQIALSKALKGDATANILLQDQDRLRIYHLEDVQWTGYRSVEVSGAVRRPRKYYRSDNMRVFDMVLLAGGLNDNAYASAAQLQRQNPDDTYGPLLYIDLRKAAINDPKHNVVLNDRDILTVLTIQQAKYMPKQEVAVRGAVQSPGDFALAQGMTARDLLMRGQNLLPTAYTTRIFLQRTNIDGTPGPLLTLNADKILAGDAKENVLLQEKDVLTVFTKEQAEFVPEKAVVVAGAVQKPGKFPLAQGMTIKDLVLQAGNTLPTAYTDVVFLQRYNPDGTAGKLFTLNLEKALEGEPEANLPLQEKDKLDIYTEDQYHFVADQSVIISGAVQQPRLYTRAEGMRLKNLIELAGGTLPSVYDIIQISHSRRPLGSPITKVSLEKLMKGDEKENVLLEDGDHITVLRRKDFLEKPLIVTVTGAVKRPGPIPLTRLNARVSDIIKEAGGFMDNAFPQGAQFYREPSQIQDELQGQRLTYVQQALRIVQDLEYQRVLAASDVQKVREITKVQQNSVDSGSSLSVLGGGGASSAQAQKPNAIPWDNVWAHPAVTQARPFIESELRPAGNVTFSLDRATRSPRSSDDIVVKDGDKIYIPERPASVAVIGAVAVPQYTLFKSGMTLGYYTSVVGGFTPDASPDYILVIRSTGKVLRGTKGTRIELGDMIFVPTKVMAQKLSDKQNDLDNTTRTVTNGLLSLALIRAIIK